MHVHDFLNREAMTVGCKPTNCLSLSAYRSCVFGSLNLRSNLNARVNFDYFSFKVNAQSFVFIFSSPTQRKYRVIAKSMQVDEKDFHLFN